MPATEVVELERHPTRSHRHAKGWAAVAGLPLIVAGSLVFAAGGQKLTQGPATARGAGAWLAALGLLLFASGFLLGLGSVSSLIERRRRNRMLRERPHEPWHADFPWNEHGDGNSRAWVRFERFPFFLGDTAALRVGLSGRCEKTVVTLLFVREQWEHRGGKTRTAVAYQHWAETKEWTEAGEAEAVFALPTGDYETRLSEPAACYWEVEVKGESPSIRASRFLVPVYAKVAR